MNRKDVHEWSTYLSFKMRPLRHKTVGFLWRYQELYEKSHFFKLERGGGYFRVMTVVRKSRTQKHGYFDHDDRAMGAFKPCKKNPFPKKVGG